MLKIYGTSRSRAMRSLWAAEELGIAYEHVPTAVPDARKPEFLKINPNGHVPAIDDDGTILCESIAINLYLAEKYGKAPLWPAQIADRGRVFQWSFWGMMECEGHLLAALMDSFSPENQRNPKVVAKAFEALKAPFKVLDDHLKSRPYLLGSDFTIADCNLAGVLVVAPMVQYDMSSAPAARAWLEKCLSRPAMRKAQAKP